MEDHNDVCPLTYCVMSEEEMTYTEGGANLSFRLSALGRRPGSTAGSQAYYCHPRLSSKAHPTNLDQHRHRCHGTQYMDKSTPEHHLRCRLCYLRREFMLERCRSDYQCPCGLCGLTRHI